MDQPKDRYIETFETWNKVAKLYDEKFMNLDFYDKSYDKFCESLPLQAKVMDIGCGPGNITKYLFSKRPDLAIFGIDISPNMIELAKINNPQAKFAEMDGRNIRTLNLKFDAIISGFFIPYISEKECKEFFESCSFLLNDKGIFYFSFLEGDIKDCGFQTGSSGDRVYFNYHDLAVLKNGLKENGFHEIQILKVDFYRSEEVLEKHTIVIAKKELGSGF